LTEAPHRARDEWVAFVWHDRNIERNGAVEKGSQLGQCLQRGVVNIDHRASHHH
jgi:hypothetical protein